MVTGVIVELSDEHKIECIILKTVPNVALQCKIECYIGVKNLTIGLLIFKMC